MGVSLILTLRVSFALLGVQEVIQALYPVEPTLREMEAVAVVAVVTIRAMLRVVVAVLRAILGMVVMAEITLLGQRL